MSEIRNIFNDSTISALKENKNEITEELLDKLREESNDGKGSAGKTPIATNIALDKDYCIGILHEFCLYPPCLG